MHKHNALISLLLLAAAPYSSHLTAQNVRQPSYPVFGILQTDPQLKGSDAFPEGPEPFAPLCQYQMIYASPGQALQAVNDARKVAGCNAPVIAYMGGFTTNPGGATEIEKSAKNRSSTPILFLVPTPRAARSYFSRRTARDCWMAASVSRTPTSSQRVPAARKANCRRASARTEPSAGCATLRTRATRRVRACAHCA